MTLDLNFGKVTFRMKCSKRVADPLMILLFAVAVLITVTGVYFRQSFINLCPLYISLAISLMQSKVNRIAYLIGAVNSILYTIVYIHFKLYATAAYALLFSCTIQLATYFLWGKKPQGKATTFRAMNWKARGMVAIGFAAVWGILWIILSATDSNHQIMDISISLLGILSSILTMLAFIEYVPLMILNQVINILLYLAMMKENPAQITFLIYSIFSLVCQVVAMKKVLILYQYQKEQGISAW